MKQLYIFLILIAFNVRAQDAPPDTASFKSFDDTKIYYEVVGKGYPVILVHGFITNSESWKRSALYTDLAAAGYKVITVDLRGNGRSGKPHNPEAYENDAEAMDVMVLADKIGATKYSVVGYSRGAIIASRLLILDKRVQSVVLGGMGADFTNPEWPRRIMFYKALSGEAVPELEGTGEASERRSYPRSACSRVHAKGPTVDKPSRVQQDKEAGVGYLRR